MGAFGWDDVVQIETEPPSRIPEEAIEKLKRGPYLQRYMNEHLQRKGANYICPKCGSGTHKNGTPALKKPYRNSKGYEMYKCQSCEEFRGSIIDMEMFLTGAEFREALESVLEWAGIAWEPAGTSLRRPATAATAAPQPAKADSGTETPHTARRPLNGDYSALGGTPEGREKARKVITEAAACIWRPEGKPGLDYALSRGFTEEEIRALRLGYIPAEKRLVIPWSADEGETQAARRDVTGAESGAKYKNFPTEQVGSKRTYNLEALETAGTVWICEGLIDAMALNLCGARALSRSDKEPGDLVKDIAASGFKGTVIVAYDDDGDPGAADGREGKGRLACKKAAEQLKAAGIESVLASELAGLPGGAKDAGEVFQRDREELKEYVSTAEAAVQAKAEEKRQAERLQLMESLHMRDAWAVMADVFELRDYAEPVPTGLATLDAILDGGLYPGLTVMGAGSSMGKTTLMVQMADNMARAGRPVLFVTIEQSAAELIRKSLCRLAWEFGDQTEESKIFTRSMQRPSARAQWSDKRWEAFTKAGQEYANLSGRLRYIEVAGRPKVTGVMAAAQLMAEEFGESPVVFIDYLQILAPKDERQIEKQAVDYNVTAARQMARELNTPVFTAATLNRAGYYGGVEMESFKESGGIEYGADLLLGLQPAGMYRRLSVIEDEKARTAEGRKMVKACKEEHERREMEVIIAKQRDGRAKGEANLVYWPPLNTFGCDRRELAKL